MKKNSAFSLLELSVVLLVISILVVGVTKGAGLISSARLANARSATSKSPVPTISGLIAWYETSLIDSLKPSETVDGAQITEWRDNSPNSIIGQKNKLTKTAGSDVTYALSGVNKSPSLNFSGTGRISIANFYQGGTSQATIFLVFKPNFAPSGSTAILFDSYSGQNTFSVGIKDTSVNLNAGSSVDTSTGANPATFNNGIDYILAAYINSSASGAYVNDAATLAGNGNINAGTSSLSGATIGSANAGGGEFNGMISEVIIFNRPLKLQERKDVMSYLAKKYKISVTGI